MISNIVISFIFDAEITFGGPQARRGADSDSDNDDDDDDEDDKAQKKMPLKLKKQHSTIMPLAEPTVTSRLVRSLRTLARPQQPYNGPQRPNANDVDLSHPWIMTVYPPRETGNNAPLLTANETENEGTDAAAAAAATPTGNTEFLTIEHSNPGVECMQQCMDALVESGRAGDTRMGFHFFREWVIAVSGQEPRKNLQLPRTQDGENKKKKRKITLVNDSLPLGSLSLHNFANGAVHTFRSMERANVGSCLGTLDISGVNGLTDSILTNVLCSGSFPRLRRLSVKNCRKLTGKGIKSLGKLSRLTAIDVGGCFNVHANDVVELVRNHPSTKKGRLCEIYASGLGWTDVALEEIVDATVGHLRGLGVGFSPYISGPGLIITLSKVASTLERLSVPFCPGMDDTAAAALGKKLSKLAVLDIRGCNKVYSLSGMMEGRSTAGDGTASHLFVLGRYSGISNNSLNETLGLYSSLGCVLDGGGIGGGIRR